MKALAVVLLVLAALPAAAQRKSGFEHMSPATQALQNDDTLNPAALWLKDGEQRFGAECAACHKPEAMRGVAARYPAFDAALARPLTLTGRIDQCRARFVKAPPWPAENSDALALEIYVANASRGLPIAPPADTRLAPFVEQGRQLFFGRMGQLDFACSECHDRHAGGRLGGSTIPEGHPTGYPIYRLEWQTVGSLERRLRNCMAGVRAEPFTYGSAEMVALQLYLMQRAAGMALETPGVRP